MISSLLDTKYEAALRMILILDELDCPASIDELGALDTLIVNARSLNVGVNDLNGPHRLAQGELVRRTALAGSALRLLAFRSLVVCELGNPTTWKLTGKGQTLANHMTTHYAFDFYESAQEVLENIENAPTHVLVKHVFAQMGGHQ